MWVGLSVFVCQLCNRSLQGVTPNPQRPLGSSSKWMCANMDNLLAQKIVASSQLALISWSLHCEIEVSFPIQLGLTASKLRASPKKGVTGWMTGDPQLISWHTMLASWVSQSLLHTRFQWPSWKTSTLPLHRLLPFTTLTASANSVFRKMLIKCAQNLYLQESGNLVNNMVKSVKICIDKNVFKHYFIF